MVDSSDYGPALRQNRAGAWKAWPGAAQVEVVDAPDIDAPTRTIRRARRCDPLARILGNGSGGSDPRKWPDIDQRRHAAAERYRDDAALAGGASAGLDGSGVRSGWTGYGYGDAQVDAIMRLREAHAGMSADGRHVLTHIVIGLMGSVAYARLRQCRDGTVRPRLLVALDRLVDHYGT